jgi:hypothetical protein
MKEKVKYIPWFPFEETKEKFDIVDYTGTFKSFIINLSKRKSDKKIDLRITFYGRSEIARIMNETYRGKLFGDCEEIFKDIPCEGPLYIVENSDYMKSLSDESLTLTDVLGFKHYFITDSEWTFDIASQDKPRAELFIDGNLVKKVE